MKRRTELSMPRRRRRIGIHYDPDAFGNFSEAIARFIGTARFLVWQSVIVLIWIAINAAATVLQWDPYPFILLNLAFSTQAAYAAPLILLAQNRQEARDRAQMETDREINARTKADTEYLAREIASVRLALNDVATTEDLREQIGQLSDELRRVSELLERVDLSPRPADEPLSRPRDE
ncbi:MAG: hypothetical protein RL219_236 [Actinomycetota bacterium]